MNRLYPQDDTAPTLEGNAAHWVGWEMLADPSKIAAGMFAPNGVVVTDEMIDGAELLVDVINQRMPLADFTRHVEEPVAISNIHPECWGTPDVEGFSRRLMTLELIDYKFGHRFVDEYENAQCIAYVSGVLDRLVKEFNWPGVGGVDQHITVNITVVQPRCFYKGAPVRTWSVKASDLRAHINQLTNAASVAMGSNPPAVTNDECQDCPGRHACASLQRVGYASAEVSTRSSPVELPPEAASLELRMLERAYDRLGARISGLQANVEGYARQGQRVPFHRMEQTAGRTAWTIEPAQVMEMGKLFNVDLSKAGIKTPKQAIKAGVDAAVINAYSSTPMGSKLIPDNPADARRVFGTTY